MSARTRPVIPCERCGTIFTARLNRQGNRARYCSIACKRLGQRTRPVVPCERCGAVFTSRINRQGNRMRFCSRICANKAVPEKGRMLAGFRWAHRRFVWSVDHPSCRACGTTARPHMAHGLCVRCDRRDRHVRLYVPRMRPEPPTLPLVWPYVAVGVSLDDASLLQRINRLLPLWLKDDLRADVGQALVLAVLEGTVDVENIGREVPRAIRRAYRENTGPWGSVSIDRPLAGTDLYLRDVLADPAQRWMEAAS